MFKIGLGIQERYSNNESMSRAKHFSTLHGTRTKNQLNIRSICSIAIFIFQTPRVTNATSMLKLQFNLNDYLNFVNSETECSDNKNNQQK